MSNPDTSSEMPSLDDSAARIRRAEQAVAGLKAQFAVWVRADIDSIGVHLDAAKAAADASICANELEAVRRIAHNIKGQGGTFGCYALSEAAGELDSLIKRRSDASVVPAVIGLIAELTSAYAREVA